MVYRSTACQLTHGCNDLRLKTKLVLETTGEVADTALAIGRNVGDFTDVVEHVTAGEEQDGDQADGGPQVAVLDNGEEVRRSDEKEGQSTNNSGRDGDDLKVVDRANNWRVRRIGEMAAQPCVNGFSLVGADAVRVLASNVYHEKRLVNLPREKIVANGRRIGSGVGSSGRVEEEQDRRSLQHQLFSVSPV